RGRRRHFRARPGRFPVRIAARLLRRAAVRDRGRRRGSGHRELLFGGCVDRVRHCEKRCGGHGVTCDFSERHRDASERAHRFVTEAILPYAALIDETQTTPAHVLQALRTSGWLGAALPGRWGGGELDPLAYGLATEQFGWACSSTRTLLTVHNMSAQVILRFGSAQQRERWLPALCSGERIVAFALTESGAGSDTSGIQTEAQLHRDEYRISGTKIWCSYGLAADVYLLFAKCAGKPVAVLVERDRPGLVVEPMQNVFGTRGSMLACLRLDKVAV